MFPLWRPLQWTTVLAFGLLVALAMSLPPAAISAAAASTTTTAAGQAAARQALGSVVISNVGPRYVVASQGPLDPSQFASDSPDPATVSSALAALSKTIGTYERMWQGNGGSNRVQDLVVQFPSTTEAAVFVQEARHALGAGEVVSTGPLPSVPGARLVTYFSSTNEAGVGEAITMQAGIYVALLSFFSAAADNPQPITPAAAARVAQAQHGALVAAPGGKDVPSSTARSGLTLGAVGWAVLAVAVLAAAVAAPWWLRRRRERTERLERRIV